MSLGKRMTARKKFTNAVGLFYLGDTAGSFYWLFKFESGL